jgi:hypothetical protein
MTYVTIPPFATLRTTGGSGTRTAYAKLESPSCLDLYTIKEVSIKRFIPTRMRD